MRLFGVSLDNLTREEILDRIDGFLAEPGFHRIATVNPEFLLCARENSHFKKSLLAADVRIADGIGLSVAFWKQGEKLKARFPGADLMLSILERAERRALNVFLALHEEGLSSSQEIRRTLRERYPRLNLVDDIELAQIVLCNFGAPLQEIHLAVYANDPKKIRLAMGVGGAFDYLTNKKRRAPKWMQNAGLEWFWRFILQPKRWRRIWNAVVMFPWRVIFDKEKTGPEKIL